MHCVMCEADEIGNAIFVSSIARRRQNETLPRLAHVRRQYLKQVRLGVDTKALASYNASQATGLDTELVQLLDGVGIKRRMLTVALSLVSTFLFLLGCVVLGARRGGGFKRVWQMPCTTQLDTLKLPLLPASVVTKEQANEIIIE